MMTRPDKFREQKVFPRELTDEDLQFMREYPYFEDIVLESNAIPGPVEIDGVVCTWACRTCPELVEFTLAADGRQLGWLRLRFGNLTVQPQDPETGDPLWYVMLLQQEYGECKFCGEFATYDDRDFYVQEAVAILRRYHGLS